MSHRRGLPFVKMHGIGNDYVFVDGFVHDVLDPEALARRVSDRHCGVGSDGLILMLPPEDSARADLRMRMFNADGSESEMCGNGIRCLARLAYDRGRFRDRVMRVESGANVLVVELECDEADNVRAVRVDMGVPELDDAALPYDATAADDLAALLRDAGQETAPVIIGMGNPHCVVFGGDPWAVDLNDIGPRIETHPAFPERVNLHLVQVHSAGEVTMRTWERGSGVTLACGTGASAVCAAGVIRGVTARRSVAHLPGGDLHLKWCEESGRVFMTGGATMVFEGVLLSE